MTEEKNLPIEDLLTQQETKIEETQIPEAEGLNGVPESQSSDKNLIEELTEQKEKYIRLYAEFDNYKKRSLKEKIELIRNASQELIQDLLVVLDDFDRAKKLSTEQQNESIYPEGMKLLHHKLLGILQTKGLEDMDSQGLKFDPEFHEAITEIPVQDESMNGKIVDTIEKAYLLNKKVIRFAKVIVGKQ
ncbi:MAG: nucleotide exchange factor GrpE [Saprospiraceae bacterium]|nr:nucleotide exchange factor GrpE [Saprospiraceae bacterium]